MAALEGVQLDTAAARSLVEQLSDELQFSPQPDALHAVLDCLLPVARPLEAALQQWWELPSQAAAGEAAELARAAAARCCANLRCPNLGAAGGAAAGQGAGAKRCRGSRAVWYW